MVVSGSLKSPGRLRRSEPVQVGNGADKNSLVAHLWDSVPAFDIYIRPGLVAWSCNPASVEVETVGRLVVESSVLCNSMSIERPP
ncbi:hypothetical protein CEXT_650061 [Caerostris extrusa]|uniref:Uncharacterized protein n=1 Tax=Caerostris extrusa TaxID=172846 RepID=A0AAV4N073_CAEEX|nr:hypothetical protein CEXT_650061 [Caerostris extrusa]